METVCFSETSVNMTSRCYVWEDKWTSIAFLPAWDGVVTISRFLTLCAIFPLVSRLQYADKPRRSLLQRWRRRWALTSFNLTLSRHCLCWLHSGRRFIQKTLVRSTPPPPPPTAFSSSVTNNSHFVGLSTYYTRRYIQVAEVFLRT
jgi:hypothetical protein